MNPKPRRFYISLGGIVLLFLAAAFAGWLSPNPPNLEERKNSFHPPTKIHFTDEAGMWSPRPFVYATTARYDEYFRRHYDEDRSQKFYLKFFSPVLVSVEAPAKLYLLGADSRGRDLFSRILNGARISLSIGIAGALIAAGVGLVIGAIAGYFGGKVDAALMRLSEFFIMIPGFYFLLALRSMLPPGLGSKKVYLLIVVILSFIGWGGMARVIRGLVFAIRQNEFVPAAKVLGRNDFQIIGDHIIPHTFSYLLIVLSNSVPGYILGESALSLLGLGIQEPDISWGNLLTEAMSLVNLSLYPWILYPGLFIAITGLLCYTLGDSLQEKGKRYEV